MSRLTDITFATDTGGQQELTVQDYEQSYTIEHYGQPYDEALDASLRQNIRGERIRIRVRYELCTDPAQYRSICNNIATDLRNGQNFFYVGIDSSNLIRVVVGDEFAYNVEYAEQHGLFVPAITMVAEELGRSSDVAFEDWRFITEAVDEMRDYGLITDAVDTNIDYGSIT